MEAATTIAPWAPAGECPQASSLKFPAATTVVIPDSIMCCTAVSSAVERDLRLRDMLTTAGRRAWAVTHSTALMTDSSAAGVVPPARPALPSSQAMAWTRTSSAFGATPYVRPPMMPATKVPWPSPPPSKQSPASGSPTKSAPRDARPPNSACLTSIPVSST